MPEVSLQPMSVQDVAQWRAAREAAGSTFPASTDAAELEHLEIHVGEVAVGGVVLGRAGTEPSARVSIRLFETSLADDDAEHWPAVLDAVERHARATGARTLVTAVPPRLLGPFQRAGFTATMTGVGVTLEPGSRRLLPETTRVTLRPMTDDERRRFVPEAREFVRAGMTRAGVLEEPDSPMEPVERRLVALVEDPPEEEVLLTVMADGAPAGRLWCTLVARDDLVDLVVNTIDLVPEHRGRGLTRLVLSAIGSFAREHGLRDVRGRLYAHDARARGTLSAIGVGIEEIHLRKDLRHPRG